jgi:hypothetical protein
VLVVAVAVVVVRLLRTVVVRVSEVVEELAVAAAGAQLHNIRYQGAGQPCMQVVGQTH